VRECTVKAVEPLDVRECTVKAVEPPNLPIFVILKSLNVAGVPNKLLKEEF